MGILGYCLSEEAALIHKRLGTTAMEDNIVSTTEAHHPQDTRN